jgi:hypothetical protein
MTGAIRRLDGSTLSSAEVTRTVERLMAVGRVPGLALAILNQGEIVFNAHLAIGTWSASVR